MRAIRPGAALGAAILLMLPSPAHAAQLDAREEPTVSGPLSPAGEEKECRATKYTIESDVVARAKMCLFLYTFDAAKEDDDARDYGVVWAQTNVDTTGGWCAVKVQSEIYIPDALPVHAKVPKERSINQKTAVVSKLRVDAEGHANEVAVVKNRYILYPDELRRTRRDDTTSPGTDVVRVTWTGKTAQKLGFVSGIEISWPVEDGPPSLIPFAVKYPIRQC